MSKKELILNRGELSATQREAIRLLASGCTAKYTALVLKLDFAQIRRWMNKDRQFQSELAALVEQQHRQSCELEEPSQKKKIRDEQGGSDSIEATRR